MLPEVGGEMVKDAGALPDEFHGLHHDFAIAHVQRHDGVVRVKRGVEARPGEDNPAALGGRREPEELVVRRLWLLRGSHEAILVQDDESGGVPRVADPGEIEFSVPVVVQIGGLEVTEVPAVPVRTQHAAVWREQSDFGRVVQVMRRGDQNYVGETSSARWCGRAGG